MKGQSPTQRTLAWLREQGYTAAVTEHWNPHAGIRQDLFGCLDIVAICGAQTVGVQATSDNNIAARVAKIKVTPGARAWLDGGTRTLLVIGWKLRMKAVMGKRWLPRVVEVFAHDLRGEDGDEKEVAAGETVRILPGRHQDDAGIST